MAEPAVFDRWDGGFGWQADPDEPQQRTSHALVADGSVWLVDPVDFDGLDELVADHGEVAGVVLLLDRHRRDSVDIADRHDVPIYLPGPLASLANDIESETVAVDGELGATGYRSRPILDRGFWREAALIDGNTLVVPEAVGTGDFFTIGSERLGVHPVLRLTPPRRQLGNLDPDRLLVGHGEGVMANGSSALESALARSRWTAPRLFLKDLKLVLTGG